MALKKFTVFILVALIVTIGVVPINSEAANQNGPVILPVVPLNNTTIWTSTPTIIANYSSPSGIDNVIVSISVDGTDVTYLFSRTTFTNHNVTYVVYPDKALADGQHNVTVNVTDDAARVQDIVTAIAYCKTPEVERTFRSACGSLLRGPVLVAVADVCRDNLLFEIEATAMA